MNEDLKTIVKYYGISSQLDMLCEEAAEFIQARNKFRRSVPGAYNSLKEELADVLIVAQQIKYIIGEDTIDKIMTEKIERQLKRIEDDKK